VERNVTVFDTPPGNLTGPLASLVIGGNLIYIEMLKDKWDNGGKLHVA